MSAKRHPEGSYSKSDFALWIIISTSRDQCLLLSYHLGFAFQKMFLGRVGLFMSSLNLYIKGSVLKCYYWEVVGPQINRSTDRSIAFERMLLKCIEEPWPSRPSLFDPEF